MRWGHSRLARTPDCHPATPRRDRNRPSVACLLVVYCVDCATGQSETTEPIRSRCRSRSCSGVRGFPKSSGELPGLRESQYMARCAV